MYIAVNKEKKRVHIIDALSSEKYYCPICGEELVQKRGSINCHHFSHKNNSLCNQIDGWHYDMSEWHYDWQHQFPIENQEVVFKLGKKIHRADVFIDNTVIEFQHSPITEDEFFERNSFYNKLGYKVIWIFDVYGKEIEYLRDTDTGGELFSWKYPLRLLNSLNTKNHNLQVFLQTGESIWYRQSNYGDIEFEDDLDIEGNLIKIDWISPKGLSRFISNTCYADIEFINKFIPLKNKRKPVEQRPFNNHDITDSISIDNYEITSSFYGYCPCYKKVVYHGDTCHACNYIDITNNRCTYRFVDIPFEDITRINHIEYDKDDRIKEIDIDLEGISKKIKYEEMPPYSNSIIYYAKTLLNVGVARFYNIKTNKMVQLSGYNLKQLIEKKICLGKICLPGKKAYGRETEIFNWEKEEWVLIWYLKKEI